ncbi:nickel transport protein [Candidatus Magnetomoraceae bacterium gMMP-1]
MKKLTTFVLALFVFACFAASAQAHILWFNPSSYSPNAGETVWVEIGFGHKFPRDEIMKRDMIEKIYTVGPEGIEIELEKIFPMFYKFTPQTKGIYEIHGKFKPGFVSKTTEGKQLGNKKDLPKAVSCFAFRMAGKTLISVGSSSKGLKDQSKNQFEIFPLTAPEKLKISDTLSLKVLFEGKPLENAKIKAACLGCGDKDHPWDQEVTTNSKGIANVKLHSKGPWMFFSRHKIPYSDKAECDEFIFCSSLTIEISNDSKKASAQTSSLKNPLYLVSLGVGDRDLITLRSLDILEKSDVLVVNHWLKDQIADLAQDKEVWEVNFGWRTYKKDCSKMKDKDSIVKCEKEQKLRAELISKMRDAFKKGKIVSVVGSGDLMIYGGPFRWYLEEFEDVNPKIVPGVSCFNAANAAIGKDVALGSETKAVVLTTIRDVDKLAEHHPTLVIFTMHTKFKDVVAKLKTHYPKETPIAVVFYAGYKDKENVVSGTLDTILEKIKDKEFPFEHIVYVGDFMINSMYKN